MFLLLIIFTCFLIFRINFFVISAYIILLSSSDLLLKISSFRHTTFLPIFLFVCVIYWVWSQLLSQTEVGGYFLEPGQFTSGYSKQKSDSLSATNHWLSIESSGRSETTGDHSASTRKGWWAQPYAILYGWHQLQWVHESLGLAVSGRCTLPHSTQCYSCTFLPDPLLRCFLSFGGDNIGVSFQDEHSTVLYL